MVNNLYLFIIALKKGWDGREILMQGRNIGRIRARVDLHGVFVDKTFKQFRWITDSKQQHTTGDECVYIMYVRAK